MLSSLPADCARRYELLRPISQGGFGAVVVARQKDLDREVAIKVLFNNLGERSSVDRFLDEARITGQLRHRNIIEVLDFGCDTGTPWIVYELLPGPDLDGELRDVPFPLDRALSVVDQIASALALAHEQRILHRDLKPANVLRAADDHYKLMDFGIAKWLGKDGVQTEAGMILGTPHYLAPEVLLGSPAEPRSDLYALGIVLHQLLSGSPPFTGEVNDILKAHLERTAPPVSSLRPDATRAHDRFLERCLAKDPADRFPDATALREELHRLRDPSTRARVATSLIERRAGPAARPGSVATRVFQAPPPPSRRGPAMAGIGLLAFLIGYFGIRPTPPPAPVISVTPPSAPAPARPDLWSAEDVRRTYVRLREHVTSLEEQIELVVQDPESIPGVGIPPPSLMREVDPIQSLVTQITSLEASQLAEPGHWIPLRHAVLQAFNGLVAFQQCFVGAMVGAGSMAGYKRRHDELVRRVARLKQLPADPAQLFHRWFVDMLSIHPLLASIADTDSDALLERQDEGLLRSWSLMQDEAPLAWRQSCAGSFEWLQHWRQMRDFWRKWCHRAKSENLRRKLVGHLDSTEDHFLQIVRANLGRLTDRSTCEPFRKHGLALMATQLTIVLAGRRLDAKEFQLALQIVHRYHPLIESDPEIQPLFAEYRSRLTQRLIAKTMDGHGPPREILSELRAIEKKAYRRSIDALLGVETRASRAATPVTTAPDP